MLPCKMLPAFFRKHYHVQPNVDYFDEKMHTGNPYTKTSITHPSRSLCGRLCGYSSQSCPRVQRSFPRRIDVLGGARARNRTCDTYLAKDLSAGLTNATNKSDGYNPICLVLIVFQCQPDLFRDPSRVIMGANVCASLRWRGRFLKEFDETKCKSLNLNVTGCTCNAKSPIVIKNW